MRVARRPRELVQLPDARHCELTMGSRNERNQMPKDPTKGGPVLAVLELQIWNTHVPTTMGWTFVTSQGPINFHANREILESIGKAFLEAAQSMPRKTDLS